MTYSTQQARGDFHYTCPKCGMTASVMSFAHRGPTICYLQSCPGRRQAQERQADRA